VQVALTPDGQALAQRAQRVASTMEDDLLTVLTAPERERLRTLLRKLAGGGSPANERAASAEAAPATGPRAAPTTAPTGGHRLHPVD
jgi:hypothetical protein